MAGQFGVDNLIKIGNVIVEGGHVAEKMINQEGTAMQKASHMMLMFDELMALPTTDFSALKPELEELDQADKDKLNNHFKMKLDLADDGLEEKVEKIFAVALKMEGIVREVIALVKEFKKEEEEAPAQPAAEPSEEA